jgi:uncharacterized membrane protein YsdA (DUF1294 family)
MLEELRTVRCVTEEECVTMTGNSLTDKQKSKRLLYLFVRDLLEGSNGNILEAKHRRDNTKKKKVSLDMKIIISVSITITLTAMLFYVYLFAMRQTSERQGGVYCSRLDSLHSLSVLH